VGRTLGVLAELRGITLAQADRVTTENAERLFRFASDASDPAHSG
jgi:Tat protein secretion system quality control protein TatD with DNase activity